MGREALVVPAIKRHTATVIMAHGLGDSGAGWISLAENWRRRGKFEEVKFIFPNAPSEEYPSQSYVLEMRHRLDSETIELTLTGAELWHEDAWVSSFNDLQQAHDEPGILRSRTTLTKLITDEVAAGIPSSRIILGGFSQGGAMSIFTGVTTPHKLAGVFGLSCYLVLGDKIKAYAAEAKEANKDTPFFMGHGDADEVVRHDWGVKTAEVLRKELAHKVEFNTYPNLGHSADLVEVDDLEEFVKKCLPPVEDKPAPGL